MEVRHLIGGIGLMVLLAPVTAAADSIALAPTSVTATRERDTGRPIIHVAFSLAGLRQGPGRAIDEAILNWDTELDTPEDGTVFVVADAHQLNETGLVANWTVVSTAGHEKEKQLIRLDVTTMARDVNLKGGELMECALSSPDADISKLTAQLRSLVLVVRYGFWAGAPASIRPDRAGLAAGR